MRQAPSSMEALEQSAQQTVCTLTHTYNDKKNGCQARLFILNCRAIVYCVAFCSEDPIPYVCFVPFEQKDRGRETGPLLGGYEKAPFTL